MSTALDYLEYVPGEASTTVAVLKDRIYRSGAASVPQGAHPPPFPFIREEVRPAARMDPPKVRRRVRVLEDVHLGVCVVGFAVVAG